MEPMTDERLEKIRELNNRTPTVPGSSPVYELISEVDRLREEVRKADGWKALAEHYRNALQIINASRHGVLDASGMALQAWTALEAKTPEQALERREGK